MFVIIIIIIEKQNNIKNNNIYSTYFIVLFNDQQCIMHVFMIFIYTSLPSWTALIIIIWSHCTSSTIIKINEKYNNELIFQMVNGLSYKNTIKANKKSYV